MYTLALANHFPTPSFPPLPRVRYQNDDYAAPTRDSSGSCSTQFGTFCYITDTFIKAGSPEEVNIR